MRRLFLLLSATLLAYGGAAHAANRDVTDFLQRASAAATSELEASGVRADRSVVIRARVASDGRLSAPKVVTSSGSSEVDQRATLVLRRLRVSTPPNVLIGAEVNIAVGPESVQQARNPGGSPTP